MGNHMNKLRFIVLFSLLTACQNGGTYVVLTVAASGQAPTNITQLDVSLNLAGQVAAVTLNEKTGGAIQFPTSAVLNIASGSGLLIIGVSAKNASGQELLHGSANTMVVRGETKDVLVPLGVEVVDGGSADARIPEDAARRDASIYGDARIPEDAAGRDASLPDLLPHHDLMVVDLVPPHDLRSPPDLLTTPDLFFPSDGGTPIIHFTFDNNTNNTGSLGSNYNGVAEGTLTYAPGKIGNCVEFQRNVDGGTPRGQDVIILNTGCTTCPGGYLSPGPLVGYSYTIAMWIYEAVCSPNAELFSNRNSSGFEIYHGYYCSADDLGTCSDIGCGWWSTAPFGTWHHMLIRYAGSQASPYAPLEFFVDGNLVQKINNTTLNVFSATQAFNSYIGRHVSGGYYTNFPNRSPQVDRGVMVK